MSTPQLWHKLRVFVKLIVDLLIESVAAGPALTARLFSSLVFFGLEWNVLVFKHNSPDMVIQRV